MLAMQKLWHRPKFDRFYLLRVNQYHLFFPYFLRFLKPSVLFWLTVHQLHHPHTTNNFRNFRQTPKIRKKKLHCFSLRMEFVRTLSGWLRSRKLLALCFPCEFSVSLDLNQWRCNVETVGQDKNLIFRYRPFRKVKDYVGYDTGAWQDLEDARDSNLQDCLRVI